MVISTDTSRRESVGRLEGDALRLAGTGANEAFDRIARLTANAFDLSVGAVFAVDDDGMGLLGYCGRDIGLLSHLHDQLLEQSTADGGIWVVPDLGQTVGITGKKRPDGEPMTGFFAGISVVVPSRELRACVCLYDKYSSREWTREDSAILEDFGQLVIGELLGGPEGDHQGRTALLEELRRNQRMLTETEQAARIGGGELDFRTGISHRTEGLRSLYGLDDDEEISFEEVLDFLDAEDQQRVREIIELGQSFEMELPLTNARGKKMWVRLMGNRIVEDGEIVGVRGFLQDISAQKQAQCANREFISLVSHELRGPLTSIRATLDMLDGGMVDDFSDDAAKLLNIARRNSDRLAALVDDILDTEKLEAGKMKLDVTEIEACAVIQEVIELQQIHAQKHGVTLQAECETEQILVRADPDRLQQVLTNLTTNAVKVSEPGQTVTLKVNLFDDRWMRLSVIDRGPGIPEEFQDEIFEKFTQLKNTTNHAEPGTGLGLNIVQGLTERMGGRVDFKTIEGVGTKMIVDLPLATQGGR